MHDLVGPDQHFRVMVVVVPENRMTFVIETKLDGTSRRINETNCLSRIKAIAMHKFLRDTVQRIG